MCACRMSIVTWISLMLLCAKLTRECLADKVVLKSGKTYHGRIVEETDTSVTIETDDGKEPTKQPKSIVRQILKSEILEVLRKGDLGERALLFFLLLRPRTLMIGIKVTSLLGILFLTSELSSGIVLLVGTGASLALLADLIYYLIGSSLLTSSGGVRALRRFPLYLLLWARAMVLSVFAAKEWLSVRNRKVGR